VLAAWLWCGAALAQPAYPRELAQAVLSDSFAVILERHLDPVSAADLAVWTLRGLEAIDPSLKAQQSAGTLLLSGRNGVIGARPLPTPPADLAPELAALPAAIAVAALFEAAWRRSVALQRAGPASMLRNGFDELFNHLDPYSRYLGPEDAAAARSRRIGRSALGLTLGNGGRRGIPVTAVAPGSAAALAGLRVGDRLLAIDGETLLGGGAEAASVLLEGPEGSTLTLGLQRRGRGFEATLLRAATPPETLRAERRDGILWLRLEGFSNATDRRLTQLLTEAQRGALPRGIVLDLRGNRGGLLTQAVAVASAFLNDGLVAATEGRVAAAVRGYAAAGPDVTSGLPLVVLIDGRTASAAEIVAAALADRRRAVVIGSATQGKGLIQLVLPLADGGELLVSWSRVLAPDGWPIQDFGVLPSLCTSLGADALAADLAALRGGTAPMAPVLARLRAARAPAVASEVATLRSACPPAEGRDSDLAAARALIEAPEAMRAAMVP